MKKYYRIEEGSMVSGVCSGLEAYTGIDSLFWRIGFILIPSSGVAYFLLWLLAEMKNDTTES
jgi:phage shock protein PspC (stress-responsive transcriptional regulator)